VNRKLVYRIRKYVEQLFGNRAGSRSSADLQNSAATLGETPRPLSVQIPSARYPDRTSQAAWLVEQGLLSQQEAEHLLRSFNLPPTFEQRVLARFPRAEAVSNVAGITSELVIPALPDEPCDPPFRTFDGPYPPHMVGGRMRHLPIELHVARSGKVFIGQKLSTLMLDRNTYHAALARPASGWVTAAFADAPGALKLDGTVAILFANGATHFSHWMFDLLPKLEVLRRAGWTDDKIDYYVVNAFRTGFQKETMNRLGISPDKIVAGSSMVISADRFLIPSDIRANFRTPLWVSGLTRSLFLPPSGRTRQPENRRLHISRARSRRRKILNQDEIEPILQKFEFKTVFAEDLTIAECAELACQADEIFAPHGAGATNVVFGSPGIRLLESYSAHIAPEAWLLTHSLGGRHFLLAGSDKDGRFPWEGAYAGFSERDRNYADYIVRPPDMERALEMLTTR
jgi:capsular polysaccharide biosynthesis protein